MLVVQALLAALASRLAGVVETFSRCVKAVGVQKGRPAKLSVLELAGRLAAQPVAVAAVDAPVADEGVGVDAPAFFVDGIGQRAVDMGSEVVDPYHVKMIAQVFHTRKLNRRPTQHALVPRLKVGVLQALFSYHSGEGRETR
jgi:hypothetical protein